MILTMKTMNFTMGLITGAVVGSAIGMLVDPINDKQGQKMRRRANDLFRSIGTVVDGIAGLRK